MLSFKPGGLVPLDPRKEVDKVVGEVANVKNWRGSSENMGFGGEDAVRGPRRRSEMRVEIEVSRI